MAINGTIANIGDIVDFTYSGNVQEWVVPLTGLYKLEVWGASSPAVGVGYGWNVPPGGKGGYSYGYSMLTKGTLLYVVCGGQPSSTVIPNSDNAYHNFDGGYNGGGKARLTTIPAHRCVQGGGGATHIATKTGLLSILSDDIGSILIVAGGGGGSFSYRNFANDGTPQTGSFVGGSGGGETGNNGQGVAPGKGGDQSKGGYGGSFGQGGDWGGGGGLYGGGSASTNGASGGGAGGGSGYIGGVPEITYGIITYIPNTQNGVWSGDGKAAITLIDAKSGHPIYIGNFKNNIFIGLELLDKAFIGNSLVFSSGGNYNRKVYTIQYIWDDHTNYEEVEKGQSVLSPTTFSPKRTGYVFIGWSTNPSGTDPIKELTATKNMVLYACWIPEMVLFSKSSSDAEPSINDTTHLTFSESIQNGSMVASMWYKNGTDTKSGRVTITTMAPYTKATVTLKVVNINIPANGQTKMWGSLSISGSFGSANRNVKEWVSNQSDFIATASGDSLTLDISASATIDSPTQDTWCGFGCYISSIVLS